jgi:hypothetical protein
VHEITNDEVVQANHVYVIPPDTNLSIAGGVLKIRARERSRVPHRSIDAFFESLAQDQRERSVGVVLSGTANDGTIGLEAIKAEGGITFAQDDSAKHDSMPRSAIFHRQTSRGSSRGLRGIRMSLGNHCSLDRKTAGHSGRARTTAPPAGPQTATGESCRFCAPIRAWTSRSTSLRPWSDASRGDCC